VDTGLLLSLVVLTMPLASGLLLTFLGKRLPGGGDTVGIGAMGLSLAAAVALAVGHRTYAGAHWDVEWLNVGGTPWRIGIALDGLTLAVLVVVTTVSFLVHLFSKGYMHGDERYTDFYRWLGFFTFSMLGLVLSDNLFTLFVSWELMGLASYKLIGHFFTKPSAYMACKKAFMTTRVGDVGFFLALLAIYHHAGTIQFEGIWAALDAGAFSQSAITWISLGLFMGAAGKSAQFPLHIWLPNAMEGPTPVSALIHAATMVAAGVYLIGRSYTLIVLSPTALLVVTLIGALTALMAATIAFTRTDIKQVLAYSTISQLGFMFTALGVGSNLAWKAGLFHLVTHAFFKACLFLGSGSVIHGCHHLQDMTQMGGLRKKMPVTAATYLVACLAIAGFPFTAGFFSKDMILQSLWLGNGVHDGVHRVVFFVLAGAAAMTACYMFRSYFLTFEGRPRDHHVHDHAHESPRSMTSGLVVLALLAVASGYGWHHVFLPVEGDGVIVSFLRTFAVDGADADAVHGAHTVALVASTVVMALGIGTAAWWYLTAGGDRARRAARRAIAPFYRAAERMYWVDEVVEAVVVRTTVFLSALSAWIDATVVDGFVDAVGSVFRRSSDGTGRADDTLVDGAVQGAARLAWGGGGVLSRLQSGRVRHYLVGAVATVAVFAVVVLYVTFD
jgi:NADH-quinone oxidoreductase subunit L